MQQFKYTAINLQKEKFEGKFIAKNEEDLAIQLSKQGLFVISAKPYKGGTPNAFFTTGTGKVKLAELTTFCRQFAIMINSGISILGSLEILKEQEYTPYFKQILSTISEDVRAGMMFSEALEKHKKVFPDFLRSMVKVGERSGRMDTVLNSLADYYETDSAIKKKAKSAFAYPIMLSIMTVAIVILMLLFVVPTFRESLDSLEVEIEGLTKIVYTVSDFLLANWLYMLGGIFITVVLLYLFGKTKRGSYVYDRFKITAPVFKKINMNIIAARFARGFGLLLSSGMDVTDALDAITIVFGNQDVEVRFRKAVDKVRHGSDLSVAFDEYKIFPSLLTQMVSVGEKTNSLGEVLNRSCSFFDDQVESAITSITSKIQPIMLMIMGCVIGTLFLAIYSPMISIMTSL